LLCEAPKTTLGSATTVDLVIEESEEAPAQDVGIEWAGGNPSLRPSPAGAPSKRVLLAVGLAIAALVGAYSLGQAGTTTPQSSPVRLAPTSVPTVAPTATATPEPEPPPVLVDMLGEGTVLAELELGNRSRAIVWCRESVPGTQISSTLALIHMATSIQFGDQVVLYEELTKPWLPGASTRRGSVLQTEGLGAGNFAEPLNEEPLDETEIQDFRDGTRCESCAPTLVTLGGVDVLVGSCIHGVPFRAGMVYAIAPPVRPGQTPLALHVDCGITDVFVEDDKLYVEGEAPLVRGLYEARFELPTISFERDQGRFISSDLELLDWNCDVERSSHLDGNYLLRTDAPRSISFDEAESSIGVIGVHGPMVLGLTADQCSALTRAWWGQPSLDEPVGTPISDLIGWSPPEDERDWFYSCHRS